MATTEPDSTGGTDSSERPLAAGSVAGAGAYLLGYLIVYVTQADTVRDRLRAVNVVADLLGGSGVPAWKAVGWYLYNAHFVATVSPSLAGGTRSVDLLASADANLSVFRLVPPVLLLAAGAATAVLADAETLTEGVHATAGVVAAYFGCCVLGALVFVVDLGEAGAVRPAFVTAALLAGLAYPVVFAGAGGAAAARVRSD